MTESKINEKHMAMMNELKAELDSESSTQNVVFAANPNGITTRVAITNDGVASVKIHANNDRSGSVLGAYPPDISMNRSAKFKHRGQSPDDPNGSIGVIVYIGPKVQGSEDYCAWVLAWSAPDDGTNNKVYVETGRSTRYPKNQINWDAIYDKLNNSENQSYFNDDNDTKAEASAKIGDGNTPTITAVFDIAK